MGYAESRDKTLSRVQYIMHSASFDQITRIITSYITYLIIYVNEKEAFHLLLPTCSLENSGTRIS